MLSLFPSLFTYSMITGLILRLTLAVVLLFWAYTRILSKSNQKIVILGTIEGIIGILLVIGLFTQGAALIAAIIFAIKLGHKAQKKALFTDGVNYYFILLMIAIALMFAGPGYLAFDWPL